MSKKKLIHAVVANRDTKSNAAGVKAAEVVLKTAGGDITIAAQKTANVVLTQEQFDALHSVQRRAVRREPGVLRLVDFWVEEDGKRVEV